MGEVKLLLAIDRMLCLHHALARTIAECRCDAVQSGLLGFLHSCTITTAPGIIAILLSLLAFYTLNITCTLFHMTVATISFPPLLTELRL